MWRILRFNSLWPSDAKRRHRSGSTFAQIMACCLTTPSHCLDQCWLIIDWVLWHSFYRSFKIILLRFHSNFPGPIELRDRTRFWKTPWTLAVTEGSDVMGWSAVLITGLCWLWHERYLIICTLTDTGFVSHGLSTLSAFSRSTFYIIYRFRLMGTQYPTCLNWLCS